MDFKHIPVLLDECLTALKIKKNGVYIDATVGGAGHALAIVSHIEYGRLICIDRDPDAVSIARERLKDCAQVNVIQGEYRNIKKILGDLSVSGIDGVLFDLGVSSYQLDNYDRGFSYHAKADLDMRMSKVGIDAKHVINNYSFDDLIKILYEYGQEKHAKLIARAIEVARVKKDIETTDELADIIKNAVPAYYRRKSKHPAKRTFQAIRIEVNNELDNLYDSLSDAFDLLRLNGRLLVISFHSLEDKIVKNFFKEKSLGCICNRDLPICVCGRKPWAKIISRGITPSYREIDDNKRSRSAKLRVIERVRDV
jgi:16S rRNA (cytosine1402-N4)-methyltransferase